MKSVEAILLDLVHTAETPLYSAYRWLGRELGGNLSMPGFLRLVDGLVRRDLLRLWSIDPASGTRVRLTGVPEQLAGEYIRLGHLDETFDPFAISVTLGPQADLDAEPEWEVDLDFQQLTFRIRTKPEAEERGLRKLAHLFPNVEFVETRREVKDSDRIDVSGSLRAPNKVTPQSGGT